MKTLRNQSFFVLAALVTATTCCAQTAEDIVAKNLAAVGGKDVINATKSVVITTNLEVMGNEVPSTTTVVTGKGFKNETEFNGTKIVQCVSDHGGWSINPMTGASTATAMSDEDVKAAQTQLYPVPLANYTANGGKVELLGDDTADFKVKLTTNTPLAVTYYINKKTYLIDKADIHTTAQGQQIDATAVFSDYRKVDNGLLIPFKVERDMPQYSLSFNVQKVEVNKDIDPAVFEMPK
ncbi:MAG TPA: hypothetical protein VG605_18970 [Puia sp.]|nr:hypothetical protein [Puia sp.]